MIAQLTLPSMSEDQQNHIPVLLNEVLEYMRPQIGGVYVDGTLGMGGHAKAVLAQIGPEGHLVGIDQDTHSLEEARKNLSAYFKQTHFVNDNYGNLKNILAALGISQINGLLLDLGISSYQMDSSQRGFSIKGDGPLDMRMNPQDEVCAYDLVNSLSERELSRILKDYGEERWHNRIARNIVSKRSVKPIGTTKELQEVVLQSIPFRGKREKIHPATRTFQALRIEVNHELDSLQNILKDCLPLIKTGGRIGIIAFHSLEDRIVKHTFRRWAKDGSVRLLTKKPLRPTDEETIKNPRSRSARLRWVERI